MRLPGLASELVTTNRPSSRSNAVRPVTIAGRTYLAWTTAFFLTVGLVFACGAWSSITQNGISVDGVGHSVVALGFLSIAVLAVLHLVANCLWRHRLCRASSSEIRALLLAAQPDLQNTPKARTLISLRIGTLLFGVGWIGWVFKNFLALD